MDPVQNEPSHSTGISGPVMEKQDDAAMPESDIVKETTVNQSKVAQGEDEVPAITLQMAKMGEGALLMSAKTEEVELLDKLTTPAGDHMDIETNTLRANALGSYSKYEEPVASTSSGPKVRLPPVVGQPAVSGLGRFRKLARMVKTNLAWTRDMHDKYEEDSKAFTVSTDSDVLSFNVNNYKLTKLNYGGLSSRVRKILAKHPIDRLPGDIRVLKDVVTRLQCFNKYSTEAKQELARIIFYESFEEGRVVIQQGHIGVSFYFIVSGTVNVKVSEVDKKTGAKRILHLGQLSEGSSFGELALLHNIRRTATIVCAGPCQFLRVDKADFEEVISAVSQKEYQRKLSILQKLESFQDWPSEEIVACNRFARIVEYLPNKLIISETDRKDDFVFYVISGECYMVREILLIRESTSYGETRVRLPTEGQRKIHEEQNLKKKGRRMSLFRYMFERHFWTICSFGRYNYFGVGENMDRTFITSKTKVEVLLVPKVNFSKVGRSKTLDLMQENLNKYIPDDKTLFQNYYADMKWRKYKSTVVGNVLRQRSRRTETRVNDVPTSIRENQQDDSYPLPMI